MLCLDKTSKVSVDSAHLRTIALSNTFQKCLTTIIAGRMQELARAEGLINDEQFGFIPGRSREDVLLALKTKLS